MRQSSLKSFFPKTKSPSTNLRSVPTAIATTNVSTTNITTTSITLPITTSFPSSLASSNTTSEYELLRRENIRRNQELLKTLGLTSPNHLLHTRSATHRSQKNNRKPSTPNAPSSLPLRRSSRKRRQTQEEETIDPQSPSPLKETQFQDSSVYNYTCKRVCLEKPLPDASTDDKFIGFRTAGRPLSDPLLTRIYAVDVRSTGDGEKRVLVAAGGHGGFVSIYGTSLDSGDREKNADIEEGVKDEECVDEEEAIEPLMSWKSSRSWVSSVRFVPSNPKLLVSSSNDGGIVVWDVWRQTATGSSTSSAWSPPVVGQVRELHSGGIYSMDLLDEVIVSASKDSSLGFCKMNGGGGVLINRRVSGHHCGVIRGVSFRDSNTLADCGADRRICVLDPRLPEPCAITVESDHSTGVNVIQWNPADAFQLLSASKDPELLLYDIRNPTQPFQRLGGHVGPDVFTCHNIYRPSFVGDGSHVATSGQGSRRISVYEVVTGKMASRGFVGFDANLLFYTSGALGSARLWAAGKQIIQLSVPTC